MNHAVAVVDGELHLGRTRVAGRRGRRAVADRDEDAVTMAAEAALALLERQGAAGRPGALVLATTTPPYRAGGSVQPLAEILDLAGDVVALELTATAADGLAALRVASALAAPGRPALAVAAHRGSPGGGEDGDGAAALLVGGEGGVLRAELGPAAAEESRERWALPGGPDREADPTLTAALVETRARAAAGDGPAGVVSLAGARATARVERALGGPGDPVAPAAGFLGAAHAAARLLAGAAEPQALVVTANGVTGAARATPGPGAGEAAARAAAALAGGVEAERAPAVPPPAEDFTPYQSLPRAARERGQELRLAAARCGGCGRVVYPPPVASCPSCGAPGPHEPAALAREGAVLTATRDHVYPDGDVTTMAVVAVDGGGRFYGQAVPWAELAVGDRVRLAPRVLHRGGDVVQYFWKVEPCR